MIVSLVGRADDLELVFERTKGDGWEVLVPPDRSDGRYVVELTATNSAGEASYYTGILYMVQGRLVCMQVYEDGVALRLLPDRVQSELLPRRCGGVCG